MCKVLGDWFAGVRTNFDSVAMTESPNPNSYSPVTTHLADFRQLIASDQQAIVCLMSGISAVWFDHVGQLVICVGRPDLPLVRG